MRKRILTVIALTGILLIGAATAYAASVPNEDFQIWARLGQLAKSNKDSPDNTIFARGKSGGIVTKGDIDQASQFYILAGCDESEAREKAVDYMLSRDAMYQKAVSEGYTVTDDEVWDYLDELKVTLKEADNAGQAQTLIDQFDSEEEYWQYEFEVYQINLPIEKYTEALKQEYFSSPSALSSDDPAQGYSDYLEELNADLVEYEQYDIME